MAPVMLVSRRGIGGKRFSVSNPVRSYAFLAFQRELARRWKSSAHCDHDSKKSGPAAGEVSEGRLQRSAMLLMRFADTVKRAKVKNMELHVVKKEDGRDLMVEPERNKKVVKKQEGRDLMVQPERNKKHIQVQRKAAREALQKMEDDAAKYSDSQFLQDLKMLGLYMNYSLPSPLF